MPDFAYNVVGCKNGEKRAYVIKVWPLTVAGLLENLVSIDILGDTRINVFSQKKQHVMVIDPVYFN